MVETIEHQHTGTFAAQNGHVISISNPRVVGFKRALSGDAQVDKGADEIVICHGGSLGGLSMNETSVGHLSRENGPKTMVLESSRRP